MGNQNKTNVEVVNTKTISKDAPLTMIVYGRGGVGKTTFGAMAPKPISLDFEGGRGTKFLGTRGIDCDVIPIKTFFSDDEKRELEQIVMNDKYETVVFDSLGQAMNNLIEDKRIVFGKDNRQGDGSPTTREWGNIKAEFRRCVNFLIGTGKNVIFIAHCVPLEVESGNILYRPHVPTKIVDELINLMDVTAFMYTNKTEKGTERNLICSSGAHTYEGKDRTGAFQDNELPCDFTTLLQMYHDYKAS